MVGGRFPSLLGPRPGVSRKASCASGWTTGGLPGALGLCCAVASALIGALAMAGWALAIPALTDFGSQNVPMAPSTAVLFVCFGLAAGLASRRASRRGVRPAAAGLVALGSLAALVLLVGGVSGKRWSVEHLGFSIHGEVGGVPVGYMSPVTAGAFLAAGASLIALLAPRSRRPVAARVAGVAGALVAAGGALLLLAYLSGEPLLYQEAFIPPAAPTCAAFMALGASILLSSRPSSPGRAERVRLPRSAAAALAALFVVLAAGIVSFGVSWSRGQERRLRAQADLQVAAIAKLKATELARWRQERLGDGRVLRANPVFRRLVQDRLEGTVRPAEEGALEEWLLSVREAYGYASVELHGPDGARRFAVPADVPPPGDAVTRHLVEVARSGVVALLDLHRHGPGAALRIGVVVPVRGTDRLHGIVFLRTDAGRFLDAFLEYWPIPSRTAETILARVEGDEVVVLHATGAGGASGREERVPLSRAELPAVRAALGEVSVGSFTDRAGRRVIVATHPVPDARWGLAATVEIGEAYGPLRERLWLTVFLMAGLLVAVGAGTEAIWRRQLSRLERQRRLSEEERASLRDVIERSLNEVFVFDPETLRFRFANRGAARNLGYTEAELLGMTPLDLVPGMTAAELGGLLRTADGRPGDVHRFESVHRRKDGSHYPIEVHLQRVGAPGGDVYLAIISDITERRAADEKIRRLNRVYAVLSDVNQAIVRRRDEPSVAAEACRIAVEVGGFRSAELLLLDGGALRTAGRAPADAGAKGVAVGPESEDLAWRAVRSGRSVVGRGEGAEGATRPDAAVDAPSGGPMAALPLVVEGEPAGVFLLGPGPGGALDAEEMRLLEEMALDIGFAVETIRAEASRREAEREVRRLNSDLERRVGERTAELAAAVRELETFAYTVSHDLKAPLRAIDGYSQILVEELGPGLAAPAAAHLGRIRSAAQRMGQLIDGLLAYARIERRTLQPEQVVLSEAVGSVLAHLKDEIAAAGAVVTVEVEGVVARADREGLAIVLRNLVGNAVKFSRGSRPPRIEIGGEAKDGRCRFRVRDNGIGFDPSCEEKMYEIFQRLHRPDEFPGTGIGLSLVRKAVERMGGSIRAEGAPGLGATFHVDLPG